MHITAQAVTKRISSHVNGKRLRLGLRERYPALDVLRGMTIALMIVVNTPGSWDYIYSPLRHAAWHGFTLTDLVFPSFLFVIGNAMSFSMRKFEGGSSGAFLKKVFKRTCLIFLIGLLLNSFPFLSRKAGELVLFDFSGIRVMGVLQRIALCYGFAALVIYYFKARGALVFSVISLLGYWAVLYYFGSKPDPYSLESNAALSFDLLLLPANNLYQGYGIPFDPEGLLGTIPAMVNILAGYLTGRFIQQNGSAMRTIWILMIAGVILLAGGLFWDRFLPINKPLWTGSYVLYSTGLILLVLPLLMLVIEKGGFNKWSYFFEAFGKNPLFIYIMAALLIKLMSIFRVDGMSISGWLYEHIFLSWTAGEKASLLFALSYMLLMWLIGYLLDRRKIYIKV